MLPVHILWRGAYAYKLDRKGNRVDDIKESAQALLTRAQKKREVARVLSLKADRDKLLGAAEKLEWLATRIESQGSQIARPDCNLELC